MKLSHGEHTGLRATFLGYVVLVALWIVAAPTDNDGALDFVLLGAGGATALATFVAVERRLPAIRTAMPKLTGARMAFGIVAAFFLWVALIPMVLPEGPDTSVYNRARTQLGAIATWFSAWVLMLLPPTPKPGSWLDRQWQVLARFGRMTGNLIDVGSWRDPRSDSPGG